MFFNTQSDGTETGFVLLKKCEVKTSKNGAPYLDLIFADKDSELPSKLWNYQDNGLFAAGMIVKVRGNVEQYNGHDQFKLTRMRPVIDTDNYNILDIIPSSDIDGTVIFDKLMAKVMCFQDKDLRDIVSTLLQDKKDLLVICPAAYQLHHAIVGGLMLHTWAIVQMAEQLCNIYPNIDRELLLSGAILHDVAKTWEFELNEVGLVKCYTVEGELIGHLAKGAMFIEETANKLQIHSRTVALLQHMVLSHHGEPEYGAVVRPMFLEAEILSTLDALDARIFEITAAVGKIATDDFTDRMWMLNNRKLYNHGRTEPTYKVNL